MVDLVETETEQGLTTVGFECPWCHIWHHSYYVTTDMKRQQRLLQKFQAKAGRSTADLERYQRKKREFTAAFDRLNRTSPL